VRKSLVGAIALATLVMTGSAMAADLARPVYKASPPVQVFSWTGFYIGVHAGAAWGLKQDTFTTATLRNDDQHFITGFLGGAQVGANYQIGSWVLGAEAQFSWSDLDGRNSCDAGAPVALVNCHTRADWLGTAAARLGFAFDRTMVFVKGGGAWVHDKYDMSFFAAPFTNVHVDDTRYGWMFGTGIEHAFFGNWSAKVEYDYLDFGTRTTRFPGLGALVAGINEAVDIRQAVHLVKFGVNYRFGAGPVVANY
jgi:outer membrane immunogenic protein